MPLRRRAADGDVRGEGQQRRARARVARRDLLAGAGDELRAQHRRGLVDWLHQRLDRTFLVERRSLRAQRAGTKVIMKKVAKAPLKSLYMMTLGCPKNR